MRPRMKETKLDFHAYLVHLFGPSMFSEVYHLAAMDNIFILHKVRLRQRQNFNNNSKLVYNANYKRRPIVNLTA